MNTQANIQASLPKQVKIVEVGPRDGLQNEKETISAEVKIELVNRLTNAGFVNVEAASFVSPRWVPQMASSTEVMAGITRKAGVIYSALTPNMKGFEAALAAGAAAAGFAGALSDLADGDAFRASSFVNLPPTPLPFTSAGLIPFSANILAADGDGAPEA